MATPLELFTRRDADGIPVVTTVGEIDMSNADRFGTELGLAAKDGGRFVVDLTSVAYLDSAGVHALFGHLPRIRLIVGPLLAPVLAISGLSEVATVREPDD